MSETTKCHACGEPTWVWHKRGENFKHGHCENCGAAWSMMDEGVLDLGIIEREAGDGRRNDFQFFFEEWTKITETGESL